MATPTGPARIDRAARADHPMRWQLRDLVLVIVLGVVFGFVYWVLVQAWNALAVAMGPMGDLAQHVLQGGWLIVAPVAVALTRRAFSGVLAEVLAAVTEFVFLGSPVGPLLAVSGILQGGGSELPFALGRYRRFGWARYALSGFLGALFVFFWSAFRFGWYGTDLFWIRLVVLCASGVIIGGLLAKVLVDAIERTGVADGFASGRARRGRG